MISELHRQFIDFAKGMPAIAIGWGQIKRDVEALKDELNGGTPGSASDYTRALDLPVHSLQYTVLVEDLEVSPTSQAGVLEPELKVKLTANVHLRGDPTAVIRSYEILSKSPTKLDLTLDPSANKVYWERNGIQEPEITPTWGINSDDHLLHTTLPDPKRDSYIQEVERQILWLTGPSFVKLAVDVLPKYNLSEVAPWLRFAAPLKVSCSDDHLVLTADKATMLVGHCSPETKSVEPDPAFPYGKAIPVPAFSSDHIDFAVYVPKSRLVNFYAEQLEPAVMVSDSGGGVVKWDMAGAVGLRALSIDIGISTHVGITGVITILSKVDFLAAARAWIDGPCGTRISLATATVIGDGDFSSDITVDLDLNTGDVEAKLQVTKSEINPRWDLGGGLLQPPLSNIGNAILDSISIEEVRKLTRNSASLGKWRVLRLPDAYVSGHVAGTAFKAQMQGLQNVSMVACVFPHGSDGLVGNA